MGNLLTSLSPSPPSERKRFLSSPAVDEEIDLETPRIPHNQISALHEACETGNFKCVETLINKGIDSTKLNEPNSEGSTPLMIAIMGDHIDIVNFLLTYGANVSCRDSSGDTALHWASRKGHADIVERLFIRGANIHIRNKHGETPLHWACKRGIVQIVESLLSKGAVVDNVNYKGNTPLHIALQAALREVPITLLAYGARDDLKNHENKTATQMNANLNRLEYENMKSEADARRKYLNTCTALTD